MQTLDQTLVQKNLKILAGVFLLNPLHDLIIAANQTLKILLKILEYSNCLNIPGEYGKTLIPVALLVVARQLDPLYVLPEQDDDEDGDHYDGDIIVVLLFASFLNKMMIKIVETREGDDYWMVKEV